MSWFFLCADMFPCEDSKTVSLCLSVRPSFCLSICPSVCLSAPREKIPSKLRQYQSYISNWCMNGKVFTSTTPWKPENLIFFFQKSSKFYFWRIAEITLYSFVDVSPTLVIDKSMERLSRVLHHGNPKIWFFYLKFEIRILTLDEELKSP